MSAIIYPLNPRAIITLYRVRIVLGNKSGDTQQTVYSDYSEHRPSAWEAIGMASTMVTHVDDVYLKSVTVEKTDWIRSEGDR